MKRSVVMIAPFNTRSGYGDHARSIYYSIMDREDLDIKCLDVKWGSTPRNHLRPEVKRHQKLLSSFTTQDKITSQPDLLIDIRIPNEFMDGGKVNIGITAGVETNVVSPEFLQGMNKMNFNIVPSKFTAETFTKTKGLLSVSLIIPLIDWAETSKNINIVYNRKSIFFMLYKSKILN